MPTATTASAPPLLTIDRGALAQSSPRVQSAARWFWWIAGLSVVNTVVLLTGGNFNFIVGLAVTQIADSLFAQLPILAFIFDAVAVAFFLLAGFFAKKGHVWAFVVGGVAYVGDGILFAVFGDWLPVAFHGFALFSIFHGWQELRGLIKQAQAAPAPPLVLAAPPPVTDQPPPLT